MVTARASDPPDRSDAHGVTCRWWLKGYGCAGAGEHSGAIVLLPDLLLILPQANVTRNSSPNQDTHACASATHMHMPKAKE